MHQPLTKNVVQWAVIVDYLLANAQQIYGTTAIENRCVMVWKATMTGEAKQMKQGLCEKQLLLRHEIFMYLTTKAIVFTLEFGHSHFLHGFLPLCS